MKNKRTNEGISELATGVDRDHEVQMARSELYKLAEYSIKLHEMLKGISEEQGIKGWQQAKITKASDYISSVYHRLEYDLKTQQASQVDFRAMSQEATESSDPYKSNLHHALKEKAKSKAQQKFMGMTYAAKKGETPASPEVKKAAKSMSKSDAKDFAKTKHKGKPEHVAKK